LISQAKELEIMLEQLKKASAMNELKQSSDNNKES